MNYQDLDQDDLYQIEALFGDQTKTPDEIESILEQCENYLKEGFTMKEAIGICSADHISSHHYQRMSLRPRSKGCRKGKKSSSSGNDDEFSDDDGDFSINNDDDSSDYEIYNDSKEKPNSFNIYKSEKRIVTGLHLEIWPKKKLVRKFKEFTLDDMLIDNFPNTIEIEDRKKFLEKYFQTQIHYVPNELNAETIIGLLPTNPDALVMDPPLNRGMSPEELKKIFLHLQKSTKTIFMCIWADSCDLRDIFKVAAESDLVFCDHFFCELRTPLMSHVDIVDDNGYKINARTCLMFKTIETVNRHEIAQQRSKDTHWGIVKSNGKSRGRFSMPMIPHQIIEAMLPPTSDHDRIFIEFWPSRMTARQGWIFIDEKL